MEKEQLKNTEDNNSSIWESLSSISYVIYLLGLVTFFMQIGGTIIHGSGGAVVAGRLISATNLVLLRNIGDALGNFFKIIVGYVSDQTKNRIIFLVFGYGLALILKFFFFFSTFDLNVNFLSILFIITHLFDRLGNAVRDPTKEAFIVDNTNSKNVLMAFLVRKGMGSMGTPVGGVLAFYLLNGQWVSNKTLYALPIFPVFIACNLLYVLYQSQTKTKKEIIYHYLMAFGFLLSFGSLFYLKNEIFFSNLLIALGAMFLSKNYITHLVILIGMVFVDFPNYDIIKAGSFDSIYLFILYTLQIVLFHGWGLINKKLTPLKVIEFFALVIISMKSNSEFFGSFAGCPLLNNVCLNDFLICDFSIPVLIISILLYKSNFFEKFFYIGLFKALKYFFVNSYSGNGELFNFVVSNFSLFLILFLFYIRFMLKSTKNSMLKFMFFIGSFFKLYYMGFYLFDHILVILGIKMFLRLNYLPLLKLNYNFDDYLKLIPFELCSVVSLGLIYMYLPKLLPLVFLSQELITYYYVEQNKKQQFLLQLHEMQHMVLFPFLVYSILFITRSPDFSDALRSHFGNILPHLFLQVFLIQCVKNIDIINWFKNFILMATVMSWEQACCLSFLSLSSWVNDYLKQVFQFVTREASTVFLCAFVPLETGINEKLDGFKIFNILNIKNNLKTILNAVLFGVLFYVQHQIKYGDSTQLYFIITNIIYGLLLLTNKSYRWYNFVYLLLFAGSFNPLFKFNSPLNRLLLMSVSTKSNVIDYLSNLILIFLPVSGNIRIILYILIRLLGAFWPQITEYVKSFYIYGLFEKNPEDFENLCNITFIGVLILSTRITEAVFFNYSTQIGFSPSFSNIVLSIIFICITLSSILVSLLKKYGISSQRIFVILIGSLFASSVIMCNFITITPVLFCTSVVLYGFFYGAFENLILSHISVKTKNKEIMGTVYGFYFFFSGLFALFFSFLYYYLSNKFGVSTCAYTSIASCLIGLFLTTKYQKFSIVKL